MEDTLVGMQKFAQAEASQDHSVWMTSRIHKFYI